MAPQICWFGGSPLISVIPLLQDTWWGEEGWGGQRQGGFWGGVTGYWVILGCPDSWVLPTTAALAVPHCRGLAAACLCASVSPTCRGKLRCGALPALCSLAGGVGWVAVGMAVPRETPGHPIAPAALIPPIPTALTMGMVVGTPPHTDEGQWDQNPLSVGLNLQLTPDNVGFAGGAPGVGQVGNNRTHSQRGLPSPPALGEGRGGQLVPPITSQDIMGCKERWGPIGEWG